MLSHAQDDLKPVVQRFRAVVVVVLVTVFAFSVGSVFSVGPVLFTNTLEEMSTAVFISSTVLSFTGMAVAGWVYLKQSGRGLSYINVEYPDKNTVVETILVFIGCVTVLFVGATIVTVFNIPVAEGALINELQGDTVAILLMIGVVFLFNAPVEEFLFRGIIQERLVEVFHPVTGVVVSSLVFAGVHLPGYVFQATPIEMVYPMALIFTVSVVLGVGYWYTRNLVVVAGAHALYNAVQLATLLF